MTLRQPGAVLDGKYEIVESLGQGGMGEVYLTRHLHLQELRVVKILRQDLATEETAQKRFTREARLATQIKHPNVAILYDFSRLEEGAFYMVWEHIEGKDLGDWIHERGPLPPLPAIDLAIQGLRGLEAIHANGVIHRDISPDNMMIARDRRGRYLVKIIDLGLARNLEPDPNFEITQAGMFMGKLKYCSPEQASPEAGVILDHRSDIYSFGLVLYEMLSGLPPFEGDNPHTVVVKRLSEEPLPLTGRVPGLEVPEVLEAVVRRSLARDREERFSDAVAFIEALERVAYGIREGKLGPAPKQKPAAPTDEEVGPPVRSHRRQRDGRELTREERSELLAQIDRAAQRKREGTQAVHRLDKLIEEGKLAEARELVGALEREYPNAGGLGVARRRLEEAESLAARRQRIQEVSELVAGYIQKKQLSLAELAYDTLIDLHPAHPRRGDYESWIEILREEVGEDRRAREALLEGRQALESGDFRQARARLAEIRRHDLGGEVAGPFEAELEAAEREQQQDSEQAEHRRHFAEALEEGDVATAEKELEHLAALGITKVSLDLYRSRLADAKRTVNRERRLRAFEERFRRRLKSEDWNGARDIALELEKALPESPRPAEMFGEVARLEEESRRRRAVEQGLEQVESFLEGRQPDQAELALKVVLRLDPDNRRRKQLEKRIRALRKSVG